MQVYCAQLPPLPPHWSHRLRVLAEEPQPESEPEPGPDQLGQPGALLGPLGALPAVGIQVYPSAWSGRCRRGAR
jgi:hypothetical protein